jgi:hypothetical protein
MSPLPVNHDTTTRRNSFSSSIRGSLEQQVLDEYRSVEGRWPTRDVPGRFV